MEFSSVLTDYHCAAERGADGAARRPYHTFALAEKERRRIYFQDKSLMGLCGGGFITACRLRF